MQSPPGLTIDPAVYAGDSIIVRYRDGANAAAVVNASGFTSSSLGHGLNVVHLGQGVTVVDALEAYQSDPNVLYAEPNYRVSLQLTPNDAQFDALWGMNNTGQTGGTFDADIDAVEAWEVNTGHGNIIVAVIDTGVDYTHEDLVDNIWVNAGEIPGDGLDNDQNGFVDDVHGYNFAYNNGDPMDDHNHGTHVAGTIGAVDNNGIGVTGVNWNV
jgi:subtilisin family serine protease